MPHDFLNRRSRFDREPTGKLVDLTPRSIVWFEKLHTHGMLPLNYLHAFTQSLNRNLTWAKKHARDLYHENNTAHAGPYLDRPTEQEDMRNAKYQHAIYELNRRSIAALQEEDKYHASGFQPALYLRSKGLFNHELMASLITASLDLACLAQPDRYRYIPAWEIIERMPHERQNVALTIPVTFEYEGQVVTKAVKPDRLCGIEYRAAGGRLLVAIEADRNSEGVRVADIEARSIRRKILQYRALIGTRTYKAHFAVSKTPMVVLTATTNAQHMTTMIDLVAELCGGSNTYLWHTALPEFGRWMKVPPPMTDLLTRAYSRAGLPVAYLTDPK